MSSHSPPPGDLLPDDALPPVEPPSAGFILQLFIVPGVIVVIVVLIWVLFNWLARSGNDRDAFVRALSRNDEARWQAAFNLANALRVDQRARQPRYVNDAEFASKLAEILNREIDAGSKEKNSPELRIYLARALGEFHVPEALPPLIKAAGIERNEAEADVRRAAIEGIALAATRAKPTADGQHPWSGNVELREVLLQASSDADQRTRSVAAVAMGVIGGDELQGRLRRMLDDAHPNVRFNAATRLALLGDASSQGVLVEMLDPEGRAGLEVESQKDAEPAKRAMILTNALRAAGELAHRAAQRGDAASLDALRTAIERLLASKDLDPAIRVLATKVQEELGATPATSAL